MDDGFCPKLSLKYNGSMTPILHAASDFGNILSSDGALRHLVCRLTKQNIRARLMTSAKIGARGQDDD